MFHKDILPENEQDWYCEITLKLEGLDDFQKVYVLMRGRTKEYKKKIQTQYPKTLEEATKSAQMFEDTVEKKHHFKKVSGSHEDNSNSSSFYNGKRKNRKLGGDYVKKPKGSRGNFHKS